MFIRTLRTQNPRYQLIKVKRNITKQSNDNNTYKSNNEDRLISTIPIYCNISNNYKEEKSEEEASTDNPKSVSLVLFDKEFSVAIYRNEKLFVNE
jgi:hypothetical protein